MILNFLVSFLNLLFLICTLLYQLGLFFILYQIFNKELFKKKKKRYHQNMNRIISIYEIVLKNIHILTSLSIKSKHCIK